MQKIIKFNKSEDIGIPGAVFCEFILPNGKVSQDFFVSSFFFKQLLLVETGTSKDDFEFFGYSWSSLYARESIRILW